MSSIFIFFYQYKAHKSSQISRTRALSKAFPKPLGSQCPLTKSLLVIANVKLTPDSDKSDATAPWPFISPCVAFSVLIVQSILRLTAKTFPIRTERNYISVSHSPGERKKNSSSLRLEYVLATLHRIPGLQVVTDYLNKAH